jgi:hypothetical protein
MRALSHVNFVVPAFEVVTSETDGGNVIGQSISCMENGRTIGSV